MNEEMVISNNEVDDDGLSVEDIPVFVPIEDFTVSVPAENVFPVYSSVEDEADTPIAYDIYLGEDEEEEDGEEAIETVEYTDNEILMQLNQNVVDSLSVQSALVGLLVGVIVGFEVLKIWLT